MRVGDPCIRRSPKGGAVQDAQGCSACKLRTFAKKSISLTWSHHLFLWKVPRKPQITSATHGGKLNGIKNITIRAMTSSYAYKCRRLPFHVGPNAPFWRKEIDTHELRGSCCRVLPSLPKQQTKTRRASKESLTFIGASYLQFISNPH